MEKDRNKRKLTAILSADVVGYSRLMEEDQAWTIKNLEEDKTLISDLVEDYKGRVVDAPGDNVLVEFNSITNAVECAVKIQSELKKKNANIVKNRRMEFRIGINLGEVFEENGRIYGSGVNIAARIEGLANPGGICISRNVYDQVKTILDLRYVYLGEQDVKNISEPVRAYRVISGAETTGKSIKKANGGITPKKESPKTIAVLPFANLSPDKDQEYFVDGLSGEILNYLSKIPNLHVTSRTSSFAFQGTNKTIKEIAEILAREYILEGSVRKAGNALRITAQLIHVEEDRNLWSETYDRELKDIFKIQEDIANSVADKLKLTLESFNLVGGTENINAYNLYLKAKGKRAEGNIDGFKSALELVDKAIALDQGFALAWAFKSHLHGQFCVYESHSRSIKEAEAATKAAQKAIDLEPNLGSAYISLAHINLIKSEWIKAELNFRKGLELINGSLSGDDLYIFVFYSAVGNNKKVIELLEEAKRNDPIHPDTNAWYCYTCGLLGDRQKAEEEYRRRNKYMPKGYSDWHDHIITLVRIGSGDILSRDDIISSSPIHNKGKEFLDSPENGLAELHRIFRNAEDLSSMNLGATSVWVAYFGDPEFAMEVLEKSASINAGHISFFWHPVMKDVRKLPRFKQYVSKVGLVDYWKQYGWPDLCHPVGKNDFECE